MNITAIDYNNTSLKAKEARKLEVVGQDKKVEMPTYLVLPIKSLGVAKYQREPRRSKYLKIAKNLDMDILGVVLVSYRPDGEYDYWIIDGQNRCRALEHRKVEHVLCQVIKGLTIEEEAEKYLKLNTERSALNANQKFMGKLGKNDPIAIDIVAILERNGFSYATNTGLKEKDRVACLSSCYTIYEDVGVIEFENTFKVVRDTWDGSSASVHVQIIRGIAGFIKYHTEFYDIDVLKSALRQYNPETLLDEASELDDRRGKRNNWADKNNYIYVSKLIWKKYDRYCRDNSIKRIPWMFE